MRQVLSCEHSLNSLRYADRVKELCKENSSAPPDDQDWAAPPSPPAVPLQPKHQKQPKVSADVDPPRKAKPAAKEVRKEVATPAAMGEEEMRISHENLIETIINELSSIC